MTRIKNITETSITVFVPICFRQRNGRPRILVPGIGTDEADPAKDRASAAVLRAIARAWDGRRRLDNGEFTTLQDIAQAERVTLPFVSRFIRLAYLSPTVLDRIVADQTPVAVSLDDLAAAAIQPWAGQVQHTFGEA